VLQKLLLLSHLLSLEKLAYPAVVPKKALASVLRNGTADISGGVTSGFEYTHQQIQTVTEHENPTPLSRNFGSVPTRQHRLPSKGPVLTAYDAMADCSARRQ